MPSKRIARLDSLSRPIVAGAMEMAEEEVGGELKERLEPFLEMGEAAPDWALLQRLVGRLLGTNNQRLLDLDQQLEQARTGDKKLRDERNALAAALRRGLRSARFLLDESFGRELGLFRPRKLTDLNARELVQAAKEIAGSLRSPQLGLGKQLATGDLPQPEAVAMALESGAQALEAHLERLEPNLKRETFAVGLKEQELQEVQGARLRFQDLLFGLYRAAGQDHLAARLRPKQKRKAEAGDAAGETQEGGVPGMAPPGRPVTEGMAANGRN